MAQKIVLIPDIGEVLLVKRKNSKHLRLSVTSRGQVRVGLPVWTPYAAGVAFAKSRKQWINKHLDTNQAVLLKAGALIGKSHRLHYVLQPNLGSKVRSRVTNNTITITTARPIDSPAVQEQAVAASERALKAEGSWLLPQRLETLAKTYGFAFSEVRIRKLSSRWGSCSHAKTITLSYYLMQLPWSLIDYVLVHELVHTKHLHHGPKFWQELENVLPNARALRKQIKEHKPRVEPA